MRSLDLFAPAPVKMPPWTELFWKKRETQYRWRLVPDIHLDGLEEGTAPEGFCMEFWSAQAPATGSDGWTPVRNHVRRNEIWAWLVKTGEVGR